MTSPDVSVPTHRGRLSSLDLLRFLAALAVVLFHFIGTDGGGRWSTSAKELFPDFSRLASYGHWGVELFFIVSGFVILMSAWGRSLRDFVASRVARLFPAYWVSVVLSGVLLVIVLTGTVGAVDVREVLLNLTMVQRAFDVEHVSTVYWTLWVELRFYLLMGVFLVIGLSYGRVVAFIALWPMLAALVPGREGILATLAIADFAPYFAGGMALYLIYAFGHSWVRWALVGLNLLIALTVYGIGVEPSMQKNLDAVIIVLIFAAVALCSLTRVRAWGGAFGSFLGRLTYPLYLVHAPIGHVVITRMYPELSSWTVLLIAVVLSIGVAWLINRFVEQPLAPRVRRVVAAGLAAPAPQKATVS